MFSVLSRLFSATYVIEEVDGVLRLTKDKARKSPEEQASWSQLRRPGSPKPEEFCDALWQNWWQAHDQRWFLVWRPVSAGA
jgi:hypothetical protein